VNKRTTFKTINPATRQPSSREVGFTEQNWGKTTRSYLTTIKQQLRPNSFAKIVGMAQLYACCQNGDDAEPEDEVDERAQLMDISDDECKSWCVYRANYLPHLQNLVLVCADAVAASRLTQDYTNSMAMPLVPAHLVALLQVLRLSRTFRLPAFYPADPLPFRIRFC
jgi:hypothetical protein